MQTVTIEDATTRLSELIERASAGEDVLISRDGEPLARITQVTARKRPIVFGRLDGKIKIPDDFDAPLSPELIAEFEGR